jgi:N-glycosylase/DNA lyase
MFESGFANWFWADLNMMRREPYGAWLRLAGSLNDPPEKKTIVMAMKAFDMETLAVTGGYLRFPPDVPIMVDSRVASVTRRSGLVEGFPVISDNDIASRYRHLIIDAWARIVRTVRETTGDWFSALRLDTLIWWLGEIATRSSATAYLVSKGLDQNLADRCSREMFFNS